MQTKTPPDRRIFLKEILQYAVVKEAFVKTQVRRVAPLLTHSYTALQLYEIEGS